MRTRFAATALVAATCFGAIAMSVDAAGAAPVTESARARIDDPMAVVANRALADLQTYSNTGDPIALSTYLGERDEIATEVANRLALDPATLIAAWQKADIVHQMALMGAFTQLGVPYRRNSSKAGEGFDCSGLTTYAWGVAGITLQRQSGSQIKSAAPRTQETAMAGDLMYYPGHVMMWLGVDTAMVHSPYTGRNVEVDVLSKKRALKFGNPVG